MSLKPVQFDGLLVFSLAFSSAVSTIFGSDSAYQYVNPHVVFIIRALSGAAVQALNALIAFRPKIFARYADALPQPPQPPQKNLY